MSHTELLCAFLEVGALYDRLLERSLTHATEVAEIMHDFRTCHTAVRDRLPMIKLKM